MDSRYLFVSVCTTVCSLLFFLSPSSLCIVAIAVLFRTTLE